MIFVRMALVRIWVLIQTRFGRNIFAVGGNRDAAVLARIPARRAQFIAFCLSGMLATTAGILFASRMDAAQLSVGERWLMGAVALVAVLVDLLRRRAN